jgi:ubiquinone biosynthesis protein
VRPLGLGTQFGIVFPRDLLLVARALVGLEATTSLVVPERSFRELLEPLIADVRDAVLPNRALLKEALERRRLEYLELALDLPDLLPDLARRWGNGSPSPTTSSRHRGRPGSRRPGSCSPPPPASPPGVSLPAGPSATEPPVAHSPDHVEVSASVAVARDDGTFGPAGGGLRPVLRHGNESIVGGTHR